MGDVIEVSFFFMKNEDIDENDLPASNGIAFRRVTKRIGA